MVKYFEINGNLFDVPLNYTLVHCISVDCKMGAGIAVEFVKRNPSMRNYLQLNNPAIGDSIYYDLGLEHQVFNLITKERYFHKPTRDNFNKTIVSLKRECVNKGITKIAMPIIGSGLDKLNWEESSSFIKETFNDTDITILVVKFGGR